MGFLSPWALALLLTAPLLVWWYLRALRPPARAATIHPDLALIARAVAGRRRWRRHLPAALYLGALLMGIVALARPSLPVPEAHPLAAIVLALDSSWSMRASDIAPSRFEAAKTALREFLASVPRNTRVGLVTFGYFASIVSEPTTDHERLDQAVDLLVLQRGTAIGEALLTSLENLPSLEERRAAHEDPQSLATIILLSDGQNRGGIDPMIALEEVRKQRVTVHTIGVGTTNGTDDGNDRGAFRRAYRFDETTLRRIAEATGGTYVFVDSADGLHEAYRELGGSLVWRVAPEEATALAALAAAVLLVASIAFAELRRRVY